MSEEQPPEWLPDGWIMEVWRGKNGRTYRYYTAPITGHTFSTKADVLHYLISMMDGSPLETSECREEKRQLLTPPAYDLFERLPSGWIIEIRTDCTKPGKMYKHYVDPDTRSRFFSKEDVLCYLKEGSLWSPTSIQNGGYDADPDGNVLAKIELAPEGLPDGWIKETKFRYHLGKDEVRKDPYYTDPLSGYVFRSLKDVFRYVETGEISRHAAIPMISVSEMYSFEKSADLPSIVAKRLNSNPRGPNSNSRGPDSRRCIFEWHAAGSLGQVVVKEEKMSSNQPSFHCEQNDTSICLTPHAELEESIKKRRKMVKYSRTDRHKATKKSMEGTTQISKPSVFEMSGPAKYSSSQRGADTAAPVKIKQEEEDEELFELGKSSMKILGSPKEEQLDSYLYEQGNGRTSALLEDKLLAANDMKDMTGEDKQAMLENKKPLFLEEEQMPLARVFKRKRGRKPKTQQTSSPPCQTPVLHYTRKKAVEVFRCPEIKEPLESTLCDNLAGAGGGQKCSTGGKLSSDAA